MIATTMPLSKNLLLTASLLACAQLALSGCRPEPLPAPDAVVRVEGQDIPYATFESYLQRNIGEPGGALPSEVLSQLFDQFLNELLLSRLAVERGLVPADTGARLAVAALLAEGDGSAVEPSAEQVEAFYRDHLADYQRPDRVRLRQILTEERGEAEEAARALAAGVDFTEVADRFSLDSSAPVGDDQGLLSRSDLPTAFASTIFSLAPGTPSEIIPAEYGFHIFLVEERLPARQLSLQEAEREIRAQLRRDLTEQRLAELAREARERYELQIFIRNLPFNYQGETADGS